jgi:DNA-binding MarR family transcriptional regulator
MAHSRDLGAVATRLNSAAVHLNRALRRGSVGADLAAEHRSALSVVFFVGPIRMGALAATERLGAPAMTRTVEILERQGLVRRERDPSDERAVLISATPKGGGMVRRGRDERVRQVQAGLRRLTPEARGRLAGALGDLEDLIKAIEGVAAAR